MDPKHLMQLAVILDKGSITEAAQTACDSPSPHSPATCTHWKCRREAAVQPQPLRRQALPAGRKPGPGRPRRRSRPCDPPTDAIGRHKMGLNNQLRVGVGPLIGMGLSAQLPSKLIAQLPHLAITVSHRQAPDRRGATDRWPDRHCHRPGRLRPVAVRHCAGAAG